MKKQRKTDTHPLIEDVAISLSTVIVFVFCSNLLVSYRFLGLQKTFLISVLFATWLGTVINYFGAHLSNLTIQFHNNVKRTAVRISVSNDFLHLFDI